MAVPEPNNRPEDRCTPRRARVAVLGLSQFGAALARQLVRRGSDVLAVDADPVRIHQHADVLPRVAVADTTDEESMRRLDLPGFARVVVGIGTDLEASILTTAVLVDLGVPQIWARAVNRRHEQILKRVGAHHVVRPQHDVGRRVARLVIGRASEFIEVEDDVAVGRIAAPRDIVGRRLADTALRSRHGITVFGVERVGEPFAHATRDTVIEAGDLLLVSGRIHQIEVFVDRT